MVDKQRILIVDDDENIAELISLYLMKECYDTKIVGDGESALKEVPVFKPNLILLDLMLPGMDGYQVCREIRTTSQVPIIMLSAKGEVFDKVLGLELGADDYMTKPFSVSELLARVEALCRRVGRSAGTEAGEQAPASLVSGSFVLDENRRVLLKAGKPIELTQVEFQIMELFFRNPGVALVRERILKGVWGENYFGDVKIVDVNIRRLRMKVEDEPSHPAHILTVWGYGYRWEE